MSCSAAGCAYNPSRAPLTPAYLGVQATLGARSWCPFSQGSVPSWEVCAVQQTTTPVLMLLAPREAYAPAELHAAQTLTWLLHTQAARGDLYLAPPRSAA